MRAHDGKLGILKCPLSETVLMHFLNVILDIRIILQVSVDDEF